MERLALCDVTEGTVPPRHSARSGPCLVFVLLHLNHPTRQVGGCKQRAKGDLLEGFLVIQVG